MTSGLNMREKMRGGGEKKINMGWVTEKGKDERREYHLVGQSQLSLAIYPNISMIMWFFLPEDDGIAYKNFHVIFL